MMTGTLLRDFSNIGFDAPRRRFPGFPTSGGLRRIWLAPRQAVRIEPGAGGLLALSGDLAPGALVLLAYDRRGAPALARLGLCADTSVARDRFDALELCGWIASQGGTPPETFSGAAVTGDQPVILRADAEITVWALRPLTAQSLVGDGCAGVIEIGVKPAARGGSGPDLPPPLGEIREEFTVERGSARAYELAPGEIVQIIDVEGQQCSDFTAFRADALDRGVELLIDGTATRSMVRRSFPGPGLFDKFFDAEMRPLLNVVQDTCGRHDTFGLACTARGYEDRGFPGHLNCSDNMSHALQPYGVRPRAAWPAINFFWNTWVDATHHIQTEESHSRPGDYVALRAMDRLVCVTTACPDDLDPINGWNPTDVHVRIYRPDAPIRRAVAYRVKEDAPMSISQESAFHACTAPLTQHFAPARDLWVPVSYPAHGTLGEYWACREAVTLQDMSGLRKFDIVGPDAEKLLQQAMTRDITRLPVWRGTYALICDDAGTVIDDGTLFRLGPDLFRWCCGAEESSRVLEGLARDMGLQVRIHGMAGALPNLSLQGPKSRELLDRLVFTQPNVPGLEHLKWFGVTVARLRDREGLPFMLARSGYTGELGYELFCARDHAPALWQALTEAGADLGLTPMGSAALEILRIEAGLAAANAEFAPGIDAFESGLGFAVDLKKPAFTGRAALVRNARDPRRVLKGLLLDGHDLPHHGCGVFAGERQIGVITSSTRSPMLDRAIAMARLAVEHADTGTVLEVGQMDGRMKRLSATVCDIPFFDPKRERARA